jgi:hypothetical protein
MLALRRDDGVAQALGPPDADPVAFNGNSSK